MISFDTDPPLVTVQPSGLLTGPRILGIIGQVLKDPRYRPGMPTVWDLRLGDIRQLPAYEMREVAAYCAARAEEFGPARVALLVDSNAAFGVARMYEVLALGELLEHRTFRDVHEARAWALAPFGSRPLEAAVGQVGRA